MAYGSENNAGQDAVRGVLKGGSTGRVTVLVIAAAFLALGIHGGSLVLSVAAGIATLLAAGALIRAALARRALRRVRP